MIALTILVAVLAANLAFADTQTVIGDTQTVIIKNGQTLISYTIETYSGGAEPDITTNTFTGADVMTLKGLDVPVDAWPLFSNNAKMIFSGEAFELGKENANLRANLNEVNSDLSGTENSRDFYRSLLWIIITIAALVVATLSFALNSKTKALVRARTPNQH